MDRQHTRNTSHYSKVHKSQQNLDILWQWFLALEAVLGRRNGTKQLLSTNMCLLIPLLNFLGTQKTWPKTDQKHEDYLIKIIKNQTIAFLASRMKTSTMLYIRSKLFYGSKATPEIPFVWPSYVKSRHIRWKPHFIFSSITQRSQSKNSF